MNIRKLFASAALAAGLFAAGVFGTLDAQQQPQTGQGGVGAAFTMPAVGGTTNATTAYTTVGLMSGVGFTPLHTGHVMIIITGNMVNGTTGDGSTVQAAWGTSTGQAAQQAVTETACGNQPTSTWVTAEVGAVFSFAVACNLALTPGTVYHFDLTSKSVTGGTTTTSAVQLSAIEM